MGAESAAEEAGGRAEYGQGDAAEKSEKYKDKAYRLYSGELLQLYSKLLRGPRYRAIVAKAWTMDFVANQLAEGTRLMLLTPSTYHE